MHKICSLFTTYTKSAFRLETLQNYAVAYEDKPYQDFLAGKKRYTDAPQAKWARLIADNKAAGKTMSRVHIIQEPLTDYIKFEILWPYRDNVMAGDDIRLVVTQQNKWPENLPQKDFWLFDDRLVADMEYDDRQRFVAAILNDDSKVIAQRIAWRYEAMRQSIAYDDYMKCNTQNLCSP
jgi:hypothetical protein